MRTIVIILSILLSCSAAAQDTPSWWPPVLTDPSPDRSYIYMRPLANYNDPWTLRPMSIIAVQDDLGRWWRAQIPSEWMERRMVGDTLVVVRTGQ